MKYVFYDTCSLLLKASHLWDEDVCPVISTITLGELEHIKTAANKDAATKYAARKVIQELDSHEGAYAVSHYYEPFAMRAEKSGFELTNDTKIILCALEFYNQVVTGDTMVFLTNDLCCKQLAKVMLSDTNILIDSYKEEVYEYKGYEEVILTSDEMAEFYSHPEENRFDLFINEYLLIYDATTGECVDKQCWTGERMRPVQFSVFDSEWFGRVKPIKGDIYQILLADSLANNKITMVKGPAGSGKSYMSLGYLFNRLEHGKIDKIVVFCNTVATKNSAKLGFYPGTKDEKLLDSQIGNFLASKIGGTEAVQDLIDDGKLMLIPLSDCRGFDTTGMNAGVYITEAQNMDVELMKLTLQRIGEDSVCIIDGDFEAQVDMVEYSGSSNGMRRASQVFRGHDIYGEVSLQNIYRSKISAIAENM